VSGEIYRNQNIHIVVEPNDIPWLKIFTNHPYKEMSDVPKEIRYEIYDMLDCIEKVMIEYYNPTKINIASFGNYMPHVHWHIMARFENDAYYPEPMWGQKQRESMLDLPPFELFVEKLSKIIK
jgi:diadenosine tetraphosphate (Ap4A) HIT family hydrolase